MRPTSILLCFCKFMMNNTEAFFRDTHPPIEQDQILHPFPPTNISVLNRSMEIPEFLDLWPSLSYLMERQNQEVDQHLQLHNLQLRASLDHQRRQHTVSLMNSIIQNASQILQQKDDEIASAYVRMNDLQECLKNAIKDSNEWRRITLEKEAMALALNCTLKQIQEPCASMAGTQEEIKNPTEETSELSIICKSCWSRGATVLFLPCRHLCACKQCGAYLVTCPICNSAKTGTTEVRLD